MMKIKRILWWAAVALFAPLASAQQAGAPQRNLDPSTLSEAQIEHAQVPSALYRLAAIYKQKGDLDRLVWTLRRLVELLPDNGDAKLALASVYAKQGDKSKTYETLLRLQQQGFGYDIANDPVFASVTGTRVWDYIVGNLNANLKPFGEGKIAFRLPKGDHLYESLAYDPKRKQFLVGSVRDGTISLADKDGKLQDFIKPDADNGLWGVYAMAADPAHDALYVASTSSVYFKGFKQDDYGKAGVFKFRLSTGKLDKKYLLKPDREPQTLSSIAVGKNGQVFAADGLRNVIYRLDGGALKVLVENPRLTSVRGLAVSDDGKRLYFADYSLGVFGIDLAAGKGFDLEYPSATLALAGADGVYWYDGTLVIIENGMSPRRVMRLQLDKSGRKVDKVMPLDVANPAFDLPTYGAIDGESLYFIANSQKNEYDAYGVPKDASKLAAVKVFRSNLRFAWGKSGIKNQLIAIPAAPASERPGGLFGNVHGGAESSHATDKPSGGG